MLVIERILLIWPEGISVGFSNVFIKNNGPTDSVYVHREHTHVTKHHRKEKWNVTGTQAPFLSPPTHYFALLPECGHRPHGNIVDCFLLKYM